MPYSMRPLECDPSRIKGMSERLIISHYENNCGGTISKLPDDERPSLAGNVGAAIADLIMESLPCSGTLYLCGWTPSPVRRRTAGSAKSSVNAPGLEPGTR